ncbi:MAG TPA: serine/threonine-protein kinase, partial [Polyangiaceae bacterium]|nr:serine/threonine-protein kinase [Polyangiaceae bacterium]
MRPQPGDLINGKYRLIRLIGDGGMGSVFEARHEYLGTAVALKFLHPELSRRPGLVQRFLQEARVSASIKSIHVAHVTDVDQAGEGLAYLVMELLEGRSLQATIASQGKLSLDVALDYTMQMLAGLEAAHAIGVVHRDLKPDNVFVVTTPRGPLVKLLDFGIAKLRRSKEYQETGLTRPGVMMGTPEYMAPEQAYSADSVDARADVYSVGAILYEMLCGKRPAQGEDPQQIAAFILAHKVPRLSQVDGAVPDALAAVVHRAMAPMAADRFASVAALRNALNPFCGELSLIGRLAATPA